MHKLVQPTPIIIWIRSIKRSQKRMKIALEKCVWNICHKHGRVQNTFCIRFFFFFFCVWINSSLFWNSLLFTTILNHYDVLTSITTGERWHASGWQLKGAQKWKGKGCNKCPTKWEEDKGEKRNTSHDP